MCGICCMMSFSISLYRWSETGNRSGLRRYVGEAPTAGWFIALFGVCVCVCVCGGGGGGGAYACACVCACARLCICVCVRVRAVCVHVCTCACVHAWEQYYQ